MKANLIFAGLLVLLVWGGAMLLGAALTSDSYGHLMRSIEGHP